MASYALTIAGAVKSGLDGLTGWPTTVIEKVPVLTGRATLPQAIVYPIRERLVGRSFGGRVLKDYTIGVVLLRESLADVATNTDVHPDLVLRAKQLFDDDALAGAPTVKDVTLVESAEWEGQEFRKGAEMSAFALVFRSSEPQNG